MGIEENASGRRKRKVRQQDRLRAEDLLREYEAAASDPVFVHEMNEIAQAFDVTVADGLDE